MTVSNSTDSSSELDEIISELLTNVPDSHVVGASLYATQHTIPALTRLITKRCNTLLSQDLNWLIDAHSGLTIHYLPEHIKSRLIKELE
jgi:hypothetical protein